MPAVAAFRSDLLRASEFNVFCDSSESQNRRILILHSEWRRLRERSADLRRNDRVAVPRGWAATTTNRRNFAAELLLMATTTIAGTIVACRIATAKSAGAAPIDWRIGFPTRAHARPSWGIDSKFNEALPSGCAAAVLQGFDLAPRCASIGGELNGDGFAGRGEAA